MKLRRTARALARVLALASPLALSAPSLVSAAQLATPFNVTVRLPGASKAGFCTKGAEPSTFGAIVTIVCATGAVVDVAAPRNATVWTPIHGGAYRFLRISPDEVQGVQYVQSMESFTGVGTVTSWRMVSLADRDYLEMLIGW